jgi:hypothetical protein
MDVETWTWRHGHGDMDMETWTWRNDMETWTWKHGHGHGDMELKFPLVPFSAREILETWIHGHENMETWT